MPWDIEKMKKDGCFDNDNSCNVCHKKGAMNLGKIDENEPDYEFIYCEKCILYIELV
jgi:hypothetical protein